jgi:hypothetical protein
MWFCVKCRFWYHFSCCVTNELQKAYTKLKDFVKMPLVKGGVFGLVGTAPLVFSAARTMEKLHRRGGAIGSGSSDDWKELLDNDLGSSSDAFLETASINGWGIISSIVECPQCHQGI